MKPTRAQILRCLTYSPDTGEFVWLRRPEMPASWNGKWAGKPAGNVDQGYVRIGLFGRRFKAHVLAWLIMSGEWPGGEVDHINRVRNDNRWVNLRLANDHQNACNRSLRSDNSTGHVGVTIRPDTGRYQASICHLGRKHHIGVFDTIQEAAAARDAAAIRLHGEFARLAHMEKAA